MIEQVTSPETLAQKAVTDVLFQNMTHMYSKGMHDGAIQILAQTSKQLEDVSRDQQCPDEIRAGLAEASKFLKSIASGTPYQLVGKPKPGSTPQVDRAPLVENKNKKIKSAPSANA